MISAEIEKLKAEGFRQIDGRWARRVNEDGREYIQCAFFMGNGTVRIAKWLVPIEAAPPPDPEALGNK